MFVICHILYNADLLVQKIKIDIAKDKYMHLHHLCNNKRMV